MGKGSENILASDSSQTNDANNNNQTAKAYFNWSEVRKHNKKGDCWIVLNDNVFNLSNFQAIHPGGSKILSLYSGQDASVGYILE
jgi:cytochrome b involved in lipid metabolism